MKIVDKLPCDLQTKGSCSLASSFSPVFAFHIVMHLPQDPLRITPQPLVDGVFRADLIGNEESSTDVVAEHGYCTASFMTEGVLYKAYFQNESDAQEAQLALSCS